LISDQLSEERLGKPTALAVLSSDVMSSSAYATEQILRILIPVGGLAAFALVTPITLVILGVLAVVTICYRDVVKSYPKAGGSYVVSRDNFGPNVAQIAGAALLISYTITVAVSVAAGTDAITSAIPSLSHLTVPLSIAFVVLIAYGNLRGLKEAGKFFAIPTYFFITNMAVLIIAGLVKAAAGTLGHVPPAPGQLGFGHDAQDVCETERRRTSGRGHGVRGSRVGPVERRGSGSARAPQAQDIHGGVQAAHPRGGRRCSGVWRQGGDGGAAASRRTLLVARHGLAEGARYGRAHRAGAEEARAQAAQERAGRRAREGAARAGAGKAGAPQGQRGH